MSCNNCNTCSSNPCCCKKKTTTTTTEEPITTTTSSSTTSTTTSEFIFYEYTNVGKGNSVGEACADVAVNTVSLYSDCDGFSFAGGCVVYIDNLGTVLTGYTNVVINGSCWDIDSLSGTIIGPSSVQC